VFGLNACVREREREREGEGRGGEREQHVLHCVCVEMWW